MASNHELLAKPFKTAWVSFEQGNLMLPPIKDKGKNDTPIKYAKPLDVYANRFSYPVIGTLMSNLSNEQKDYLQGLSNQMSMQEFYETFKYRKDGKLTKLIYDPNIKLFPIFFPRNRKNVDNEYHVYCRLNCIRYIPWGYDWEIIFDGEMHRRNIDNINDHGYITLWERYLEDNPVLAQKLNDREMAFLELVKY